MTPLPVEQLETYEQRMSRDWEWAMNQADDYFQDKGAVQKSLHAITAKLKELGIPHAVVGGLALYAHGFRRYTEDVDILVTPESLKRIHEELDGLGYVPPFAGSKQLRDTTTKVKIEFLVTGQYPGDGKPKSVVFPDPQQVATDIRGIPYINLETLINLKLASGISNSQRLKDLADIQELAKVLHLTPDFAKKLDPYVQAKFIDLTSAPPDTHGKD